jgi:hypothetical protein
MEVSRPARRGAALAIFTAALAICALAASPAPARPDSAAVLGPLGMSIQDRPEPVRGADGRMHLAYEITLVNQSDGEVRLDSVRPLSGGEPFAPALRGSALDGLLRVNGTGGDTIRAGGSALLFMDVTYPARRAAPRRLGHAVRMTFTPASGPDQQLAFAGVPTKVDRRPAIEVEPPLRGRNWVAANGCCDPINAHRGAVLAIDGTVHVPERFAIDFVQLDSQLRLFEGPLEENSSYPFFGDPVRSATAGRVVRVQDGLPEQVPGELPPGATIQMAGGNYVVVRIDRGHFAFYAHLQPGSLRVERGDRVRPGQVVGLLGNTGNTDAPHLHFHVMDGPSPLRSNGLPFVFDRFRGTGHIDDISTMQQGLPQTIDRGELSGPMRHRMPLGNQVVRFR